MAYIRKTRDEWEVQGYYGSEYGWETVTAADTLTEARDYLRDHRENEKGVSFRLKKKRVKLEGL